MPLPSIAKSNAVLNAGITSCHALIVPKVVNPLPTKENSTGLPTPSKISLVSNGEINIPNNIPITLPPPSWYFLFVSNFYLAEHVFYLRQLWTISVEEQFYIFFVLLILISKGQSKRFVFFITTLASGKVVFISI